MGGGAWKAAVHGVTEGWTQLSDFTFTFHFHALEKEIATHSSVLAWRIPGMGEPGGLPSIGSHRVGHDWSDLAATAAAGEERELKCLLGLNSVAIGSLPCHLVLVASHARDLLLMFYGCWPPCQEPLLSHRDVSGDIWPTPPWTSASYPSSWWFQGWEGR